MRRDLLPKWDASKGGRLFYILLWGGVFFSPTVSKEVCLNPTHVGYLEGDRNGGSGVCESRLRYPLVRAARAALFFTCDCPEVNSRSASRGQYAWVFRRESALAELIWKASDVDATGY